MSEVQVEEKKGFSWMSLLFAPYYYAGYGKFQKGLVFAIIGFMPLTAIIVNIYAGTKAKKELPIGKQDFKWVAAIGVFLIHSVVCFFVFAALFGSSFETDEKKTMRELTESFEKDHSAITRNLERFKKEKAEYSFVNLDRNITETCFRRSKDIYAVDYNRFHQCLKKQKVWVVPPQIKDCVENLAGGVRNIDINDLYNCLRHKSIMYMD